MMPAWLGRLFEREQESPVWYKKLTEGLEPKDKTTLLKLQRSFAQRGPNQNWLYIGAGTDLTPLLVAPTDAHHLFVDPAYRSGDFFTYPPQKLTAELYQPWVDRSIPVKLNDPSWEHGAAQGNQTLQIQHGPTVELQAKPLAFADLPETIDAIYTNPVSYQPEGAALEKLKVGGFIVCAISETITFGYIDKQLEDFGFVQVVQVKVQHLDANLTKGRPGSISDRVKDIRVFEKKRTFTAEETVQLRFHALLRAIEYFSLNLNISIVRGRPERVAGDLQNMAAIIDRFFTLRRDMQLSATLREDIDSFIEQYVFIKGVQHVADIPTVFDVNNYYSKAAEGGTDAATQAMLLSTYQQCAEMYYQRKEQTT